VLLPFTEDSTAASTSFAEILLDLAMRPATNLLSLFESDGFEKDLEAIVKEEGRTNKFIPV